MRLRNYSDKRIFRIQGYFKEVCFCVCKHMMIHRDKINLSSGRKKEYVQARNMICSFLNSDNSFRLSDIASMVGYKNHTSVIHAIKMHEIDMEFDKKYVSVYNGVNNELMDSVEGNMAEELIKRITILEKKIVDLQKCLTN